MPDFRSESTASEAISAKARFRAALLATRRATPIAVRTEAGAAIRTSLAAAIHDWRTPGGHGGPLVAAHIPVGGEPAGSASHPETLPAAILAASAAGVLLPVLRPDLDLDWAQYSGRLRVATRGLYEPADPVLGRSALIDADLVVIPALAVDRHGTRLGRGGGSYDRALARLAPSTPVIALLYDNELVDFLPAEPHDRPVSAVITPSGGFQPLYG